MNELIIFITGILFSCAVGCLVGCIVALRSKLNGTLPVIAVLIGLCALAIGAAWALCIAVGVAGFVGHVSALLLAPFAYIGVFTGWNIYSYALGLVIQTGFMTLAGWLLWRWIKARKSRADANRLAGTDP